MAKAYSTIAIEGTSITDITSLLHQELGMQFVRGRSRRAMGVYIDVYDAPLDWSFLRERPSFRPFTIRCRGSPPRM